MRSTLTQREADVLLMRLEGMTYKKIGENIGRTPARARQILEKVKAKAEHNRKWCT